MSRDASTSEFSLIRGKSRSAEESISKTISKRKNEDLKRGSIFGHEKAIMRRKNTISGSQRDSIFCSVSSSSRKSSSRWTWLKHMIMDPFQAMNQKLINAQCRLEVLLNNDRVDKDVVRHTIRSLRNAVKLLGLIENDLGQINVKKITFKQLAELKLQKTVDSATNKNQADQGQTDSNKKRGSTRRETRESVAEVTAVAHFIKEEFVAQKITIEDIEDTNLLATATIKESIKPIFKSFTDWIPKLNIKCQNMEELKKLIPKIGQDWNFDVFELNRLTGNQPLLASMFVIFNERQLFQTFKIPVDVFKAFVIKLEAAYNDLPFHNRIHAADVLINIHYLLQAPCLQREITDIEVLASLVAAAAHAVDHSGLTNMFHVKSKSKYANLYNDENVNEKHSLGAALTLLQPDDTDITVNLSRQHRRVFYSMLRTLIIDLDISRQVNIVSFIGALYEVKSNIEIDYPGIPDNAPRFMSHFLEQRKPLYSVLLLCADRAYPCKQRELYTEWTIRSRNENYNQGDEEIRQNLEISPMCDRNNTDTDVYELSNITFIVMPAWQVFTDLVDPFGGDIYDTVVENRMSYEKRNVSQRVSIVNPYGIGARGGGGRRSSGGFSLSTGSGNSCPVPTRGPRKSIFASLPS